MRKKFTVLQLSELVQGEIVGGHSDAIIEGIAELEEAGIGEASFLANPRYVGKLKTTRAGVVCARREHVVPGIAFIVVADPTVAFQKLIDLYKADYLCDPEFSGVHPQAYIHPTAKVGAHVSIGPFVSVGPYVEVGDHTRLYPGCVLGAHVVIGDHCILHANVAVREGSCIKNRVIIQPGAIIGSCGFGYATSAQGEHTKLQQLGNVIIEDDVEIGAATTIDRARFLSTRIGRGTKIDNLVQIGHGVEIGNHCIIVAQTGIAGSTKIGNYVIIGGQVGISGHLTIGDRVAIAAKSGVSKSLAAGGKYAGHPAILLRDHQRAQVRLRQLTR